VKTTPLIYRGRVVRIARAADEIFDPSYLGRVGIVHDTVSPGHVGDSPGDPFIRVRFRGGKVDGFWTEELGHLSERPDPPEGWSPV